jgi:hypothetical protein
MANLVNNTPIKCTACGYGPFRGRESSSKNRNGSIYTEYRWICPRCNRLVRLDEKTVKQPKKDD